jgi:tRNA1Val (adenine37-N6)-methyltransferase
MSIFRFKRFSLSNEKAAMKVNTDGVLLGAWVNLPRLYKPSNSPLKVLDIGTGTGVIALVITQRCEGNLLVTGIDIDPDSAQEAKENFANSPWSGVLTARHVSFQEFVAGCDSKSFDLIVSNPPFFIDSQKAPSLRRNTARHNDTLEYEDIIDGTISILAPGGRLALILPVEESRVFERKANLKGLELTRLCLVRSLPDTPPKRALMEFSFSNNLVDSAAAITTEELVIQTKSDFTQEYKSLTCKFYLNF